MLCLFFLLIRIQTYLIGGHINNISLLRLVKVRETREQQREEVLLRQARQIEALVDTIRKPEEEEENIGRIKEKPNREDIDKSKSTEQRVASQTGKKTGPWK